MNGSTKSTTIATIPTVALAPSVALVRSGIRKIRYTTTDATPISVMRGTPNSRWLMGDASHISRRRYGKTAAAIATTMNVMISAAPAVKSRVRKSPGPYTMRARKIRVMTSTITLAQIGECVRSFTSLTLSGRIRSKDQAKRLRVAIRKVGGRAAKKASTKLIDMIAIRMLLLVSMAAKKK